MALSPASETHGPADKDAAISRRLARIDELSARLEKLEAENFALRAENAALRARVAELKPSSAWRRKRRTIRARRPRRGARRRMTRRASQPFDRSSGASRMPARTGRCIPIRRTSATRPRPLASIAAQTFPACRSGGGLIRGGSPMWTKENRGRYDRSQQR